MSSGKNKSSGRAAFIVAVVVLGLAAVGLNGATNFLRLYFKKEPVELSLPLQEIPARLGPWSRVGIDHPLPSDIEHTLGTEKYVFRVYVDTRVIRPELLSGLQDTDLDTDVLAARRVQELRAQYPAAFVNMAVTYYTGMVDTVAHIPDRCMVADGYEPTKPPEVLEWDIKPHAPVTVRYINFEDQTARGLQNKNVAYFFQVNGAYESDPITGVRLRLQDLRERRGYYAKIELMNLITDQAAAKGAMTDFLSSALPEIERCLPDWQKVKADDARAAAAKG